MRILLMICGSLQLKCRKVVRSWLRGSAHTVYTPLVCIHFTPLRFFTTVYSFVGGLDYDGGKLPND